MKAQHFKTLEEALTEVIPVDKEYTIVWHRLLPDEKIEIHSHSEVDEWIFIKRGCFKLMLESEKPIFKAEGNKYLVFSFPKETKHGLTAITKIYYFVVRTK